MKTENECRKLFSKETLYEAKAVVRTTAYRFIVRAINVATQEECKFIVDCKQETITKI